jgi:hypothetical protein
MLVQNTKVLAFGFTKKYQFVVKTHQNFTSLGRETYIMDRLYITVLYIIFYGFLKI